MTSGMKSLNDNDVVVASNFNLRVYELVKYMVNEELRESIYMDRDFSYFRQLNKLSDRMNTFRYVKHLFDEDSKLSDWNLSLFIDDIRCRINTLGLGGENNDLIKRLNLFVGKLESLNIGVYGEENI